ncbi:MAG: HAD family hydrolase [Candidatus Moranbacteria bacterium]|nr:HAD family hydrolase [Candidatus Moranbacteria bacterium]
MKVFIDFDDVIFNTKEFSAELKSFFESQGISQELFQKYYYAADDNSAIKLFDPEGLIARLEKYEKIDASKLRENFDQRIENLTDFVFPDVVDFLNFVGKENVYLISFGLPIFQNKKIVACGINKLVSGCIVTGGSKASAIGSVMEKVGIAVSEKIIFIDDRIEQVQDIKQAFPAACTFLLCRKEGRYCDEKNEYCDYEVHNLKEAQEIINEIKQ